MSVLSVVVEVECDECGDELSVEMMSCSDTVLHLNLEDQGWAYRSGKHLCRECQDDEEGDEENEENEESEGE